MCAANQNHAPNASQHGVVRIVKLAVSLIQLQHHLQEEKKEEKEGGGDIVVVGGVLNRMCF